MNITRENLSELDLLIKVEIVESDYAEEVKKQLKSYKNKATVPGFRKGMAPMGLIERMYKSAIVADTVQNLLSTSLYKYLDDENFGDKWYSYNGTQFMTEVGADIASKASAIERESVLNNQEIPGYIFRMKQKGITSDEIDDAIAAIKAGSVDSLDEGPVKMIAETIQSHINKTGAQVGTNITPEQYNRF